MWFRKKALIECVRCGCLMRAARRVVEVEHFGIVSGLLWSDMESYCGKCAPLYDIEERGEGAPRYYLRDQRIEITEKGKIIKEKQAH